VEFFGGQMVISAESSLLSWWLLNCARLQSIFLVWMVDLDIITQCYYFVFDLSTWFIYRGFRIVLFSVFSREMFCAPLHLVGLCFLLLILAKNIFLPIQARHDKHELGLYNLDIFSTRVLLLSLHFAVWNLKNNSCSAKDNPSYIYE